jgi:CBS domain-containing protein
MTRSVRSAMSTEVMTAHPDTPFKAIVLTLAERGVDALPVVDETGSLLGVVSGADLTCHEEEPPGLATLIVGGKDARRHVRKSRGRTAAELMTSPARTIGPDADICEALREMSHSHVGRLVVVDGERVVGMLARSDVLRVFLRSDEELQREAEAAVLEAVGGTPHDISVAVGDGIVHLRGWVERTACAWAASAAARGVPGVVDVDDSLASDIDDTLMHEMSIRGPFPGA